MPKQRVYDLVFSIPVFAAALALVSDAIQMNILTYDPYWLLTQGNDFLSGRDPSIDRYSFTMNGRWVSGPFPYFGIIFSVLAQATSLESAVTILRITTLTLGTALVFKLKQTNANIHLATIAIVLILLGIQYRFFIRPELFDYLFLIYGFILYKKYSTNLEWSGVLHISAYIFLWSNYHVGILAYVIASGIYLQNLIAQIIIQKNINWIIKLAVPSGIILIGVGFLTPEFSHPIISALSFSSEWSSLIREHIPFTARFSETSIAYAIWPCWLLITALAIKSGNHGAAFILFIFAIATWERIRMLSFFAIACGCTLLIISGSKPFSDFFSKLRKPIKIPFQLTSALGLIIITFIIVSGSISNNSYQPSLPLDVTEYLHSKPNLNGNVLNTMHAGGWIQHNFGESLKVHIDGRTNILYPIQLLKESNRIKNGNWESIKNVLEKYEIDYFLYENNRALYTTILEKTAFKPEFIGESFTLYSQTEYPLALTDLMLNYPMCFETGLGEELANELEVSKTRYSIDSSIVNYLRLLVDHTGDLGNTTSAQGGDLSFAEAKLTDRQARSIAYAHLTTHDWTKSSEYFAKIQAPTTLDLLTNAHVLQRLGNFDRSAQLLLAVTSGYWQSLNERQNIVTSSQLLLAISLYQAIISPEKTSGHIDAESIQSRTLPGKSLLNMLRSSIDKASAALAGDVVDAGMLGTPVDFVFKAHCPNLLSHARKK